jgi:predicted ATPase
LLVTSRSALHLRAERRFSVEPLAMPNTRHPSLDELAASPAIRLFIDRAQAVAPELVLDARSADAVATVCWRLGGYP